MNEKVDFKYKELKKEFSKGYLAMYDLLMDTGLNQLPHHTSVVIRKGKFE